GGWWAAFAGLVGRSRRRYGGYVVHAAIVILLVGAIGIGGFSTTRQARLDPGESMAVGDYDLVYTGTEQRRGPNAQELRARLVVERGDERVGTMQAGKNRYLAEQQTSNEVGIRTDWLRGEDLFVIADQFNADGSVFLKVRVNPLVNFIWLAGLVFVLGSLVAMWPDAREQRRLAQRFAGEGALARA
ncbi:MAG: cytochrome c-type biogenesis CcmF C-terminal domain-containing protein, partial [Gaiellaceae bacterium]